MGYVETGKMFICTAKGIPPETEFFCSPSTTVANKLPGRTISVDKRLIWDGRRINLRCPKEDYWKLITPSINDLAIRFCRVRTAFPGVPVHGAKRDIDAAFTRCRLHPDAARMFGTEFDIDGDRTDALVFFYLVLPFGFAGSPVIFGRVMDAVQYYHQSFVLACPEWNDSPPFHADVFVDDGMFLEAAIGHRQDKSVLVWGRGADLFFGLEAISKKT